MENYLLAMDKICQLVGKRITKKIMEDRYCKKCDHLCHCVEADFKDCKCENCECSETKTSTNTSTREEDATYE